MVGHSVLQTHVLVLQKFPIQKCFCTCNFSTRICQPIFEIFAAHKLTTINSQDNILPTSYILK